jgi:hypothetical protein
MLKRDKTLVNEAGECGYCHITEDDVREHILKKAHAIRLDVWNTLTDVARRKIRNATKPKFTPQRRRRILREGPSPPRCALGSAILPEFFLRNGSN